MPLEHDGAAIHLPPKSLASERASIQPANEAFSKGSALLEKRQVCESIPYFLEQIKNGNHNAKNRAIFTLGLADNYALLGDRENTLYWLEKSFEGEKGNYPFAAVYLGVEPRFAFVCKEPRFQAILQKMNLKIN